MPSDKTYNDGPRINEVAGHVITHLLDYGEVRGSTVAGTWRPASVRLAEAIFQDEVVTRSLPGHEAAYTRYFTVMAALELLEVAGFIETERELTGAREVWKITLTDLVQ